MEEDFLNYKDDIAIDRYNLDTEWTNHADMMMKYAEAAAAADRDAKKADEKAKTIRSELILSVSGDAGVPGSKKSTDKIIEAYYRTHPDYLKAVEEKIEAEHNAEILRSVGFAFAHRKTALENLVRLQSQSYYSTPGSE